MKESRTQKTILLAAALLLAVVFSVLLFARFGAELLMFFSPKKAFTPCPGTVHLAVADGVSIATRLWEVPGAKYTILYSHGNGEMMPEMAIAFQEYCKAGFSFAAYDYEGYGESGGKPSCAAVERDAERVYRYLTEEKKIPPQRILFYGRSIGSGAACYLADRHPEAAGLILEAPFTSTFGVVKLDFLPFDRLKNIERISRLPMPLLIFHGDHDLLIDCRHSKALYQAAKGPKRLVLVPGAGHNSIVFYLGSGYYRILQDFAASLP